MTEFVLHPNGERAQEEELRLEGWVRQFTADEPRLSEAIELYECMGYEVRVEEEVGGDGSCNVCFSAAPERYRAIYVRPKPGAPDKLEELF